MRRRLTNLLFEMHLLLRDQSRARGNPPGAQLERDIEWLANFCWLPCRRRTKQAPGLYYSGLQPETDLFVYEGSQFLQVEIKDTDVSRLAITELWARALDLHLGSASNSSGKGRSHYVVIVTAGCVDDRLRTACIRWGINLVEPQRVPLLALNSLPQDSSKEMISSGCSPRDFDLATSSFDRRFPLESNRIIVPYGRFRRKSAVESVLKFQALVSSSFYARQEDMKLRRSAA